MVDGTVKRDITQFLRFLIVGVANTILSFSIIFGLIKFFGASAVLANAVGYAAGLCLSFFLNSSWTFSQSPSLRSVGRFLVAFAISYLANLGVLTISMNALNLDSIVAQVPAMATYTLCFFVLSRVCVFTERSND